MTIKHISFDVWNTLITANKRYALERSEVISYFAGISPKEAEAAYAHVKMLLDMDASLGICSGVSHAWYTLGKFLGVDRSTADKIRMHCEGAFTTHPPHLDGCLVDKLSALINKYELSIKSNTNFISGEILSEALGFYEMPFWSFTHFSDEYGWCKPDPLFFQWTQVCSDIQGIRAEEVLHVGDSEIFDGKCVDIGFNFCKIDNPEHLLNKLKNGELFNA